MMRLLQMLFTWSMTVATVGACALLLTRLLRRHVSARSEYIALVAVLLLVMLLPIKPSIAPAVTIPVSVSPEESVYAAPNPVQFIPQATQRIPTATQTGGYDAQQLTYPDTLSPASTPAAEHRIASRLTLPLVLTVLYAMGAIAFLMVQLTRHVRFMRHIRRWQQPVTDLRIRAIYDRVREEMGIRRDIPIYICAAADSPMVAGVIRPRLLLPDERLNFSELNLVLRHELTHIRRHDLLIKALQVAAISLHWFNPIVHVMNHAMNYACEASCDESVVRGADMDERQYYSETIIAVIRRQSRLRTALSTSFYGGKKGMKNRILTIMDPRVRRMGALLLIPVLLMSLFFTVAVATEPAQSTNPPDMVAAVCNLDKETGDLVTQEKAYELALDMLKKYDDQREFDPISFEIREITWMDVPVETAVVGLRMKENAEIVKYAYMTARACAPLEITQLATYDNTIETWRWLNIEYITTLRKDAIWDTLPQTAYILNPTAASANMCEATTSYTFPQGTYYNGVKVKVLELHTMMNNVHMTDDPTVTWARVEIGATNQSAGTTGWMPLPALTHEKDVLGEKPPLPTATLTTGSETGFVIIYAQNDLRAGIISSERAGTAVKLLGRLRDFYHVELANGQTGFVEIACVQVDAAWQASVAACEPENYDQVQPGFEDEYEEYMSLQDELWEKYGDSNDWPLEIRALRTQIQLAYGFDCEEGQQMHILPGENDLTEDEARKIANQHVKDAYDMGAEDYYRQTVYFYYFAGAEDVRIWGFTYFANAGLHNVAVRLNAQTGEIIESWQIDYISSGPGTVEDSDYTKNEIGYYYDTGITIPYPEDEDLALKEAAVAQAQETFMRVYPEYGDMALYTVQAQLQHDNKGLKWYLVQIAHDSAWSAVFEVIVTLEDPPTVLHIDVTSYRENVEDIKRRELLEELQKTKGHFLTWTLEEQHEWNPDLYGLPRETDISKEEAIRIATQLMVEGQYMTPEDLAHCLVFATYFQMDTVNEWRVHFYTPEDWTKQILDGYQILINPRTGDVLDVWAPGGNG